MCGKTSSRSTDFCGPAEKTLFEKLITVSGIGPKLAITILSGMAADEMVNAIRGNDIARLTRIPGIGKKTAERMVLELRDKLPVEKAGEDRTSAGPERSRRRRALGAGESRIPARGSGEGPGVQYRKNGQFDAMFRQALAVLSK